MSTRTIPRSGAKASASHDHAHTRAALAIVPGDHEAPPPARKSWVDRLEAFLSRLTVRSHLWHRVSSMIWLPYAFRSGIKMRQVSESTFTAVLPFRRFNRNWYNAMAGAALLGNSEIAGGMYVFGIRGGDFTVVCKQLEYKFLRPCFGPALYKIRAHEDVGSLVAKGEEFNISMTLDIVQDIRRPGDKPKRVGRCTATFHATPKEHHEEKRKRTTQE